MRANLGTPRIRGTRTSGRTAERRRALWAAAVLFLATLVLSLGAAPARAEAGVTVIEVSPQFHSIDIRNRGGLNYVDVVVSDYNSWKDVYRVRVAFLNDLSVSVAEVQYQQYPTNTSAVAQPSFSQPVGDYLVGDLSSARHSDGSTTIPERTDLRLTFVMSPVKAAWVNVTAVDRSGAAAYAQVQYASGFIGGLPTVAGWILPTAAAVATAFVVGRRIWRDRRGS